MAVRANILNVVIFLGFEVVFAHSEENCVITRTLSGSTVNCHSKYLQSVPADLPDDVITLDLSSNHITSIPDNAFRKYTNLQWLDLSNNHLHNNNSFKQFAFKGLNGLNYLKLMDNGFRNEDLPPGLFGDLKSLEILLMDWRGKNYREISDEFLKSIEGVTNITLNLDVSEKEIYFTPGFAKLKELKRIELWTTTQKPLSITTRTFENFANSSVVSLALDCGVRDIGKVEEAAFRYFQSLKTMILLGCSFVPFTEMIKAIKTSNLVALHTLVLDSLASRIQYNGVLQADLFNSLSFKGIKHLSMKDVGIGFVELNWFKMLSSLTYLSVGYNTILPMPMELYDPDIKSRLLQILLDSDLEVLDFSHFNARAIGPQGDAEAFSLGLDETKYFRTTPPSYEILKYKKYKNDDIPQDANNLKDYELLNYLPNTLTTVYADSIPFADPSRLKPHTLTFENNVAFIDLSDTRFSSSLIYEILHYLTKIKVLKCSRCDFGYSENFKRFCDSRITEIEWLYLDGSRIDSDMLTLTIFSAFPKLKYLDLTSCGIKELSSDTFVNNMKLQVLKLQGNNLKILDIHLQHMSSLHFIDVSSNLLETVGQQTMTDIDAVNKSTMFEINFKNNAFKCTCDHRSFIHWLRSTDVNITSRDNILCEFEDEASNGKHTEVMLVNIHMFDMKCEIVTVLSIVFTVILVLVIQLGIIAYRKRVYIYWYSYRVISFLTRFFHRHCLFGRSRVKDVTRYEYRAMILYNTHSAIDRTWVNDTLIEKLSDEQLFNVGFDLLPGGDIIEELAKGLEKCEVCIIILSSDFTSKGLYEEDDNMITFLNLIPLILKSPDRVILIEYQRLESEDLMALPFMYRLLYHQKDFVMKWYRFYDNALQVEFFWERLLERVPAVNIIQLEAHCSATINGHQGEAHGSAMHREENAEREQESFL